MRTTLNISPDLLNAARHLAAERCTSLGDVISELALEGLAMQSQPMFTCKNGFPVFIVPATAPTLNLYDIKGDEG